MTGASICREHSLAAATLFAQAPIIGAQQEEVAMAENIGRMLMKAAREMGAEDLRLEHGGRHPRVTGRIGERPFMYVVPGSSSDWRAGRNALSGLRRLIGYEKPKADKDGPAKGRSR
jgi:hypothetical protein